MTPYFERDGITIYCGDNVEVLSQLEQGSIDLTVTSPPYDNLRTYNGYAWDFEAVSKQLWRVTMTGGVVVWVVGDATVNGSETGTSFRQALGFMGLGFNLHDTMIYQKDGLSFPDAKRYYDCFEYTFIFSSDTPKSFNRISDRKNISFGRKVTGTDRDSNGKTRQASCYGQEINRLGSRWNIWQFNNTKGNGDRLHPAPFPEALARDHIISWSNEGDLVCDPFLGSGTTAKMAQQLGRRFVGCDISEEYCKIAVDRLRQPSFFSLPTMKQTEPRPVQEALL